ncbi:hypothetical protein Ahy_A06g028857 [Arachis hypogaea]|uniref:Uncharacterized protein n=1 Tax=Arachis hypogaea TaxID=3818 RepID=A0A445CRU1_ARAHY|nr:hypothetical protein Ahy_A06g028857 [Arachis hypogaea]
MDPMNLDSKFDLLRPVIVVAISLLLCPIISMTTLSTTPIASFNFFSEPMFNNRFSFHMSGNGDIARCTDSLDVRSKLSANLDSGKEGMKHSSGKRCTLGIVVKLGLEDVVDVSGLEVMLSKMWKWMLLIGVRFHPMAHISLLVTCWPKCNKIAAPRLFLFPFGCGMNFHILISSDYQNWFASRFKYTTFTNAIERLPRFHNTQRKKRK